EQGARRLILMSRTALPRRSEWARLDPGSPASSTVGAIRDLERLGVAVHPASVDVADEPQLTAFLTAFREEGWPAIRGVVHAAGVLHTGPLLEVDVSSFLSTLRPKVMGGWLLHHLLDGASLDFFVLF